MVCRCKSLSQVYRVLPQWRSELEHRNPPPRGVVQGPPAGWFPSFNSYSSTGRETQVAS